MAHTVNVAAIGGKAAALRAAARAGLPVPPWVAIPAGAAEPSAIHAAACDAVRVLGDAPHGFAVRSSATEEDGAMHSFAGQFDTFLGVGAADVPARVSDVRAAASARVQEYRRARGLGEGSAPAVLVQRMLAPRAAGVAFGADPATGRRGICVVAAVPGIGQALVDGTADADTWHITRDGRVTLVQRVAPTPTLSDDDVRAVAAMARSCGEIFGRPQDIEWAFDGATLWLLQSRPITTLSALPDPDAPLVVWDDSNIAESYGGVTTPLTFSFARYVYENVYRQFCRVVGVPGAAIEALAADFATMLGLARGRVYYNLVSWHRVLAALPGYRLNRAFMEQMMGVREPLPAEVDVHVAPARSAAERRAEWWNVARMLLRLVGAARALSREVPAFRQRLDDALRLNGTSIAAMRPDELVAHWHVLERRLLTHWDTPLVNDLFAMISHGLLRKLLAAWAGDADGVLSGSLVAGAGDLASAVPAHEVSALAARVPHHSAIQHLLVHGSRDDIDAALHEHDELRDGIAAYIARYGDRCLDELKLETPTLADDPLPLYRAIGWAAARPATDRREAADRSRALRASADRRLTSALRGHPLRSWIVRLVLGWTRQRVSQRETLRFERTRLFGRVRRLFLALGDHLAALGRLETGRDVLWLEVHEVIGAVTGTATTTDLVALVALRRAEFARWAEQPRLPERFVTRGPVVHAMQPGVPLLESTRPNTAPEAPMRADDTERRGLPAYPGVVRGRARVVRDPRTVTLAPGDILVAERTDPGWVLLFPAAAAVLVERGSLLSHAAIVSRELGLPAVVGIPGLTTWLIDGELIELDGAAGRVRRVGAANAD
ncbi:MAG: PEP/pyruvate-binding domain-containing protein [Gemmatimonadaceae bacterium]|nr:PEP/pyruvate-binding domain-containing protein [Gemmatimonadaceae bacterium]